MNLWSLTTKAVAATVTYLSLVSKEVCYKNYDIGCFSNKAPFDNAAGFLPMAPVEIGVRFLLYTRQNNLSSQAITKASADITSSNYNGRKKTKLIIHGYRENGTKQWIKNMTAAILIKEDVNIIVVDWEKGACGLDYNKAVANTRVVGALMAQLVQALQNTSRANYSEMHMIGHSLGAHISGYAGKRVPGIGRITGLDPAGLSFDGKDAKVRLNSNDASFVDIIHTGAGKLLTVSVGISNSIGDADFYPNYGDDQPGCLAKVSAVNFYSLVTGNIGRLYSNIGCSHSRAISLFIDSINVCTFTSYPCNNGNDFKTGKCPCFDKCVRMGYDADLDDPSGNYYLLTNSHSPFCK